MASLPSAGPPRWLGRPLAPRYYIAVVALAAFFALIMPRPSSDVRAVAMAALKDRAQIALIGPSVVRHRSKCDGDRRSIVEMLADATPGRSVSDLSYDGQPLILSIQIAALAAAYGQARDVVLLVSHDSFLGWPAPPYGDWSFFRLLSPNARPTVNLLSPAAWAGLAAQLDPVKSPFAYKGVDYPKERVLFDGWFVRERALTTCPETATHDWARLEAYTWHRQIEPAPSPAMIGLVAALDNDLRKRGKRLHIVMLPINDGIYARFDPAWTTAVHAHAQLILGRLRDAGLSVLDLTALLPAEDFSTVWCVCTHFNAEGRRKVADAIAEKWFGATYVTTIEPQPSGLNP